MRFIEPEKGKAPPWPPMNGALMGLELGQAQVRHKTRQAWNTLSAGRSAFLISHPRVASSSSGKVICITTFVGQSHISTLRQRRDPRSPETRTDADTATLWHYRQRNNEPRPGQATSGASPGDRLERGSRSLNSPTKKSRVLRPSRRRLECQYLNPH